MDSQIQAIGKVKPEREATGSSSLNWSHLQSEWTSISAGDGNADSDKAGRRIVGKEGVFMGSKKSAGTSMDTHMITVVGEKEAAN